MTRLTLIGLYRKWMKEFDASRLKAHQDDDFYSTRALAYWTCANDLNCYLKRNQKKR